MAQDEDDEDDEMLLPPLPQPASGRSTTTQAWVPSWGRSDAQRPALSAGGLEGTHSAHSGGRPAAAPSSSPNALRRPDRTAETDRQIRFRIESATTWHELHDLLLSAPAVTGPPSASTASTASATNSLFSLSGSLGGAHASKSDDEVFRQRSGGMEVLQRRTLLPSQLMMLLKKVVSLRTEGARKKVKERERERERGSFNWWHLLLGQTGNDLPITFAPSLDAVVRVLQRSLNKSGQNTANPISSSLWIKLHGLWRIR